MLSCRSGGVHPRETSEGRRVTETLLQQLLYVVTKVVGMLCAGMQQFPGRCRFFYAIGLGSEVLTFLFVVWCPRDHAKLHCNKAIKYHLFHMLTAFGLVDV